MTNVKTDTTFTTYCGSPDCGLPEYTGYTAEFYDSFRAVNINNPNVIFWFDKDSERLYVGVSTGTEKDFEYLYQDAFVRTGEDYTE